MKGFGEKALFEPPIPVPVSGTITGEQNLIVAEELVGDAVSLPYPQAVQTVYV